MAIGGILATVQYTSMADTLACHIWNEKSIGLLRGPLGYLQRWGGSHLDDALQRCIHGSSRPL